MNARLLVTYDCPRSCPMCCNKDMSGPKPAILYDMDRLRGLRMVLITGGEPLLYPERLLRLIHELRMKTTCQIIVYTAITDAHYTLERIIRAADGSQ